MCGIAGIACIGGRPPERHEIERMCAALVHRGPDDTGSLFDGAVALGMRRLAVIDLIGGHQPIGNEDGSVAVIQNGEIYNYRELRRELESQGHHFATESDTEVIAHLWEQVGVDFPRYLNGMFAIAVYDRKAQKLVLARDHVGIKPLYYQQRERELVFASEVKALLASGRCRASLSVDALGQFMSWEYVPGADTLLQGVRRLLPGHLLIFDCAMGTCELRQFWSPLSEAPAARQRTEPEWLEAIDTAVRRAVQRQLVSDVPLGAFLSGGVDSSLVVAHMGDARTFSIGFDDRSYDELPWARRVARHLGVQHRFEVIRPQVEELFGQLMEYMDDPIADVSIFPTYLVSRLARTEVTVALTGDGGDELFGGYEAFRAQERSRAWQRLPGWLRDGIIGPAVNALRPTPSKKGAVNKAKRFVEGVQGDPVMGHARWRLYCDARMRETLFADDALRAMSTPVESHIAALRETAAVLDERDRSLFVEFSSYLVDNCLAKVDRMSMACSLEARVPLLDRDLVELAFQVPSSLKFDGSRSKILLKAVAARYVPRDCVYRAKEGFSVPMKNWLRSDLHGLLDQYLDPGRVEREGLFRAATVRRLRSEHEAGVANHAHLLWSLLVFERWRERWGVAA